MVESQGKVLVTSGYTDYVKNLSKPGQNLVQKLLASFFPSTVCRETSIFVRAALTNNILFKAIVGQTLILVMFQCGNA